MTIDGRTPRQVQSIGREERRGSIDGSRQVGIRNGTKTFKGVRSGGTSGVLNQLIVDGLAFLAVRLVEGGCIARVLRRGRVECLAEAEHLGFVDTYEDGSIEWRFLWVCDDVGCDGECSCALAPTA